MSGPRPHQPPPSRYPEMGLQINVTRTEGGVNFIFGRRASWPFLAFGAFTFLALAFGDASAFGDAVSPSGDALDFALPLAFALALALALAFGDALVMPRPSTAIRAEYR